jgi:lipopolysaccharide transport system ATP-binding protein
LAVGDAEFQKKALGKMKDVSGQGRTVLFVSHNMNTINNLCNRTIFLKNGEIYKDGITKESVALYISESMHIKRDNNADDYQRDQLKWGVRARIISFNMQKEKYFWKERPRFSFTVKIIDPLITEIEFGFALNGSNGTRIFTYESNKGYKVDDQKTLSFDLTIEVPILVPSKYYLSLGIRSFVETIDALDDFIDFEVLDIDDSQNYFGFTQGPEISGYIDTKVEVKKI